MDRLLEEAKSSYSEFLADYQQLVLLKDDFISKKIFRGRIIEKYIQLKDKLVYYVYNYFPQLYEKYFNKEPSLPKFSTWYYIINGVLWIPDKTLNFIWWPKYGEQVTVYMEFYTDSIKKITTELKTILN